MGCSASNVCKECLTCNFDKETDNDSESGSSVDSNETEDEDDDWDADIGEGYDVQEPAENDVIVEQPETARNAVLDDRHHRHYLYIRVTKRKTRPKTLGHILYYNSPYEHLPYSPPRIRIEYTADCVYLYGKRNSKSEDKPESLLTPPSCPYPTFMLPCLNKTVRLYVHAVVDDNNKPLELAKKYREYYYLLTSLRRLYIRFLYHPMLESTPVKIELAENHGNLKLRRTCKIRPMFAKTISVYHHGTPHINISGSDFFLSLRRNIRAASSRRPGLMIGIYKRRLDTSPKICLNWLVEMQEIPEDPIMEIDT